VVDVGILSYEHTYVPIGRVVGLDDVDVMGARYGVTVDEAAGRAA
jgi:hypothetical protein